MDAVFGLVGSGLGGLLVAGRGGHEMVFLLWG